MKANNYIKVSGLGLDGVFPFCDFDEASTEDAVRLARAMQKEHRFRKGLSAWRFAGGLPPDIGLVGVYADPPALEGFRAERALAPTQNGVGAS